ncbi:MAG: TonB-dependent receptor [Sphingomonas bacterium]|nr:TonB-dependent receptor [Sphingomonas bacterium]
MKKAFLLRSCAMFAVPLAATAILSTTAQAQQITTEINGQVNNEAGEPLANATVIITDTRTGATDTTSANAQGYFSARNLSTGGPYTVTATAPNFQGQTVNDITTSLQGATQLSFTLTAASAEASTETIVVTGARARVTQLATGPGTSFGADVLESAPSFNRDIRDVIRADPRVSLDRDDQTGQDRISCLGGNDRGNAFTVDGITQSDVYGLNDTGFSSRSSTPLPYDAIRETQVQFAPFDVEFGQFTGCAINVVTRGGTNKFHGGGFFEYTDNKLTGDKLRGQKITIADFSDKRWGVSLGGPVFKNRLFLFGAYESRKSADTQEVGPAGLGYATEIAAVTEANFNAISQVLRDTYGIETGPLARSLPFTNERWFARADFQITDNHRLEGTFQRIEEARIGSDDFFSGTSPQVTGYNTFLTSGSVSNFYSGRLYSKWTDNISTELRYSRSDIRDRQDPVGGGEAQSDNPIPRIIVGIDNPPLGTSPFGQTPPDATILAGPGSNRSANDLRNRIQQYKGAIKIGLGDHSFKVGAELNTADVFNLFVANATGTLVFRNIADLQAGLLSPGIGSNQTDTRPFNVVPGLTEGAFGNFTASGDINSAAAKFKRSIYTLYAQDDWRMSDNLNVVLGLRADFFKGDHPTLNPNFKTRFGFGNDTGFSDIDPIILPRVAATYDLNDFSIFSRTKLRAGVGVFSGGDPLVWFANSFQNDGSVFGLGTTQGTVANPCPAGQIDVVVGGVFTGVPACAINGGAALAAVGQANTQSIDPDIKMATVVRTNLGFETRLNIAPGFFSGWRLNGDYILSRYRDPFTIVDLAQAINPAAGAGGYTIDGRPIYRQIDLTRAGCTGKLVDPGAPPRFENLNAACFGGSRIDEMMLTNAKGFTSQIFSALLAKDFGSGIFTPGGGVYFSAGYAYTDSHDRRNMFNSTATSNYDQTANDDRQNPDESRGYYGSKHNITLATSFREKFFGDLDTKFGISFVARSGRPYSLTFSGGGIFSNSASGNDNALLYVPTGPTDPNLSPSSNAAAVASLNTFVDGLKCAREARGTTIKRNTCNNDWYYDMDLRISQQLPGAGRLIGVKDTIEVYAMVDNFLNVLSNKWNVFRRRSSVGVQDVASISGLDSAGRYIISGYTGGSFDTDNEIKNNASLWRLKFGASYKF